ncbi:hypothetical protein OSB04_005597 [Centaurea solstitialis]|uniref:Reverse transcriptase Ty1/copia-type domain-containing protein n=1 Tax=Centaurea solstitialis TaxID=347529 RepID=A0AA38WGM7_9ASTR|nr:hypothetical protein OSB04_005597 [Centaurea solstitialis]
MAMLKSIRILMAISAYFNYEIWQMDVKTAFLDGKLTEDVYMEQPEGFIDPKNPNKVCKLLKSIYGLKQASRSWNLHFDERIKEFGFAKSEFEPCVYTKFSGSIVTFLVLYVDDILLIGNNVPTLQSVKSWLSKCFQMKDLGEAAYILGIKIYRNRSKRFIGLSQSTYIDKILKKFRMDESKKGFIPMQHGIVLSKTQCPVSSQDQDKMKSVPYASAIGSIMYAMLCTRPDVAYSVSVTSRYQQNPGGPHWVAVKNILKYLRRTKDMFLVFGGSEDEISVNGYSDASFQTDRDDFRSQSGYVFTLNGGAISWKSSKQDTIADSTTEAEYIAAFDAAKEAVWLRNFLSDLRVVAIISRPIDIFCDNSGAVAQAKEPREHHKSRHVLRKYHLIREIIGRGDVKVCKIPTEENVADPLTKPLARVKHEAHANSIGMQYLDARWLYGTRLDTAEAVDPNANSLSWIRLLGIVLLSAAHRLSLRFPTKPTTIRTVLSIALCHSWSIHQLDVKNAFLHGNLNETVYMHQPMGFRDPQYPDHVCLLKKSLYGLQQAPRAWYQQFADYVATIGFSHSKSDHSLFVYKQGCDIAYILLYVDDIILTTSSDKLRTSIMALLASEFAMKDLGPLIDTKPKLSHDHDAPFDDPTLYRSLAGALQYLTFTRPDISYAVQQVCLHMHNPKVTHMRALKRVLWYIKGTLDLGLYLYPSALSTLTAYTDADWGGCPDTRRSTSGYCVFLGDNLLSWSSKRQPTLSRSSAEAEYRGVANVVSESCWLRNLLLELHCPIQKATNV